MSDDIIRVCGEDGKGTTDLKQNSKGERISDMTCENEAKKEYLNKYRENKEAVERIEAQIKEFELHEISPRVIRINTEPHGSRLKKDLSDYAAKKDELCSKMIQARYRRVSIYTDIFQAIEDVPDERERQILTLRYIKCLKWEEIAVEMHLEWAQVHRIHAKALKHFNIPEVCTVNKS